MARVRGSNKTICPSEVARSLWPNEWRKHMDEIREAAFILRDEGKVMILQKGEAVPGDTIKGPIRIKIVDDKSL